MCNIAMISIHTCPLAVLGGKEAGGMNVYVREISRELGRRGMSVDVYTRLQNPNLPRIVPLGEGARVIHLEAGPSRPYNKNLVYKHVPQFSENVIRFADEDFINYDLIHSHYWLSGAVSSVLKEEWQVPVVQMFHTLAHIKNSVAKNARERETELRIEVERETVRESDQIIASTSLEKAQLAWFYGAETSKITVVPCGVNTELFSPGNREEIKNKLGLSGKKVVLFVGRIEPLKGIDTLIKAFSLARRDFGKNADSLQLLIVGGDSDQPDRATANEIAKLKFLCANLEITDKVSFLGPQSQEVLPDYYRAADLCVVPSHYESFCLVALEAMACGTPVIASNAGGLSFTTVNGKTGFLVPEENPEALSNKMHLVLANPDMRGKMGAQAHALAQNYSWVRVADRILAVYRELIPWSQRQVCVHMQ